MSALKKFTHFAIIGAGPSGFYAAQQLLTNKNFRVDIFDSNFIPYGLARYGVAPDQQAVKNCIHEFKKILKSDNVRFFGNTKIGKAIGLDRLKQYYNGIILTTGANEPRKLGIPGEESLINSVEFTKWYNKHPEFYKKKFNIGKDVAIIGNGNVALDIARILLFPETLEKTDINELALKTLKAAEVDSVTIYGRKTPLHTSFTALELRPFLYKPLNISINHGIMRDVKPFANSCDRKSKRVYEIFEKIQLRQTNPPSEVDTMKRLHFKFLLEPTRTQKSGQAFVEFRKQKFLTDDAKKFTFHSKNETVFAKFDTVISAVGSSSSQVYEIGSLNSKIGQPLDDEGRVFSCGWCRSNGKGVIADSLNESKYIAKLMCTSESVLNFKILNQERETFLNSLDYINTDQWSLAEIFEERHSKLQGKPYKIAELEDIRSLNI
eukprot:NODE_140_length_16098_cov_0.678605.p2 type:complete len:436 gc:universal NODE_140_length_16098_cov_0.678605:5738-4431(-)